ncbi:phosphoglycerate mutase-like [Dorcoceras hygrometricum]|uniref:Phosphoglycerate mutase-like n=1 Tax=Dorcoceras hygrometricum TaxID=472368 RepID=A0A2Z7CMY3_9LAMI|nr:phosphoglycerate mutase-like [Dorcoceras hygrometricum]
MTSRCFTKITKRCRLNKLTRHRFNAKGISRWNITHVEKKPAGAFIQMCSSRKVANNEGSAGHQKGISGYQQKMNSVAAEADNITEAVVMESTLKMERING